MKDKSIIYVAGNPDAYPLEYYNSAAGTYQGVIPCLLSQFSAQSRYEVRYLPEDGEDHRDHLARNLQVDLLSGYREEEVPSVWEAQVPLFQTVYEGREQTYSLYLTAAAPASLESDLRAYFASVSPEAVSGILVETSEPPANSAGLYPLIGGLALAAAILAALLLTLAMRYRRRLRRAEARREADEVTGLGNFDYLLRYYRQMVNDKNRVLFSMCCFQVDTDRLRRLGGSQEADAFLRYCAVVLQEYTAESDILARVSDRSFVLLKYAGNPSAVSSCISPLFPRIRAYAATYHKPFEMQMTAGIYPLRAEDRDLNEIIFRASQGAHEAFCRQIDYVICTDEMRQKLTEDRKLQGDLEQALKSRAFQLYLQFYVDARSFRIMGGEALSRWQHPQKGLLTPKAFIPLLEREGLIDKLDYYCLEEACRFLDALMQKGVDHFFISCNFSRETFSTEDFAARCLKIMAPYSFPKELLIFELTESASATHISRIKQNMAVLKEYGVSIALDDFGVGFTSFSDLQQYPVDGVKLDKRLIDNIMTEKGIAILRAMVQVGHELGITILAEGVENEAQVQALQRIHCDVIQGFQFFAPIPASEAIEEIMAHSPAAPALS